MNEYSKKEPLLNRTAAVSNVQTNQNVLMFDKDSYNGKGAEQRSYFNADRSELHTNNTGALAMERNNYNSNNNYGNNYANQNGYAVGNYGSNGKNYSRGSSPANGFGGNYRNGQPVQNNNGGFYRGNDSNSPVIQNNTRGYGSQFGSGIQNNSGQDSFNGDLNSLFAGDSGSAAGSGLEFGTPPKTQYGLDFQNPPQTQNGLDFGTPPQTQYGIDFQNPPQTQNGLDFGASPQTQNGFDFGNGASADEGLSYGGQSYNYSAQLDNIASGKASYQNAADGYADPLDNYKVRDDVRAPSFDDFEREKERIKADYYRRKQEREAEAEKRQNEINFTISSMIKKYEKRPDNREVDPMRLSLKALIIPGLFLAILAFLIIASNMS